MRFQVIFISKSIQIVDRAYSDLSNWRARTSDECISVAISNLISRWAAVADDNSPDKFTGMAQMQLTPILFDHLEPRHWLPRSAFWECAIPFCRWRRRERRLRARCTFFHRSDSCDRNRMSVSLIFSHLNCNWSISFMRFGKCVSRIMAATCDAMWTAKFKFKLTNGIHEYIFTNWLRSPMPPSPRWNSPIRCRRT